MTQRMEGKVALITGGARGQGASHAELLAAEGAAVLVGDILDAEGVALAARLTGSGARAGYVHLDVTKRADWENAVRVARESWGDVDVLVNNAGIASWSPIIECTDEEWERIIAVNQTGIFFGMRAVLPAMVRRGAGAIVNISSTFGLNGGDGSFAYQTSKGAILSMTKGAALSYGPSGVRVNAICPGVVDTPLLQADIQAMGQEGVDGLVEMQAIKRYGTPADISSAVLYLASEESSFVTGAVLVVDGGYSAL